jgi:uncharacterized membrane protein
MLTQIWFIVNLVFVATFIAYLFVARSSREAESAGPAERAKKLRVGRRLTGLLAIALFIAAAAIFVANMAING